MTVTRFAPSPTGHLHLGHAFSAAFAWRQSKIDPSGGSMLVRIEDIDATRCKKIYESSMREDLKWLGFSWPQPERRQSEHLKTYQAAVERLHEEGWLYPCFCTRGDIQSELSRMKNAPHGPAGFLYPGICLRLSEAERRQRIAAGQPYALRLDSTAVATRVKQALVWRDQQRGTFSVNPHSFGDVILARKEFPASYHLAVVVDDAIQGITLVTRGEDLLASTPIHRLLQHLLDLPVPEWLHHRLILDDQGRRLAKRDGATSLCQLRTQGWTFENVSAWLDEQLSIVET